MPPIGGLGYLCSLHSHIMHPNPYIQHIVEMTGESPREVVRQMMPSLQPMTFPCEIHGRRFESHDEYMNELHDYLNGL